MIYRCEDCEREFDEPREVSEEEMQDYECLNEYIDKCCPYCLSSKISYDVEEMKKRIIKDIQEDCSHISEIGYDNWKQFLSDCNGMEEDYDEVLWDEFTEEELEDIWQKAHNK
jgi:hypothetical protein